jgi:alkanesulfonate monooxygenase SsuD/methylene tetrahydromethanopterin reductase-like flavin-dependent oxidoreductase (luciferase family)
MVELGRDPGHCRIMFGMQPIIGSTAAEARDKQAEHNALVSDEGGMAILSAHLDFDLSFAGLKNRVLVGPGAHSGVNVVLIWVPLRVLRGGVKRGDGRIRHRLKDERTSLRLSIGRKLREEHLSSFLCKKAGE